MRRFRIEWYTIGSVLCSFSSLEIRVEPVAHALLDPLEDRFGADPEAAAAPALALREPETDQAHRGRVHGAPDHVLEPTHAARDADPHRHLEDLLRQLADAFERGAAAGQHHAGRHAAVDAGLAELLARQRQDLVHARRDDLAQQLARHPAGPPAADARHRDHVVAREIARRGHAEADLDALGVLEGRAWPDPPEGVRG